MREALDLLQLLNILARVAAAAAALAPAAIGVELEPLVDAVADGLRERGVEVATGRFGADMQIDLRADGPVTIVLDVPA